MKISYDTDSILGIITAAAFAVNLIVQLTKGFIPLPTKLWCILVAFTVDIAALFSGVCLGLFALNTASILLSVLGSFVVAFIAMYGFDTFKELWQRFKDGERIDENK